MSTTNNQQPTTNNQQPTTNNNPLLPTLRKIICLLVSVWSITAISYSQEPLVGPCTKNPECTEQWESRTVTSNLIWYYNCPCALTVEYRIRTCDICEIIIDRITYDPRCIYCSYHWGRVFTVGLITALQDPSRASQCRIQQGGDCIENISVGVAACWKKDIETGFPDLRAMEPCAVGACCFARYKVCWDVRSNPKLVAIEREEVTCNVDLNDPNQPWYFGCDFNPCPLFPSVTPEP